MTNHKHETLSEPNRLSVFALLAICVLVVVFFPINSSIQNNAEEKVIEGSVLKVISNDPVKADDLAYTGANYVQKLLVEILDDNEKSSVEVLNILTPIHVGEKVFLHISPESQDTYSLAEVSRTDGMISLAILFLIIVLAVNGRKGFNALVGLFFSFVVIFYFILPAIISGHDSVTVTLGGSLLILVVTLYSAYGFNNKSLAAFCGISITLALVGLLAQFCVYAMHFTGYSSEAASFLKEAAGPMINILGILISGVIIATIGVIDDIAITQAAVVNSLLSENPSLKRAGLFSKAMSVGKDHISAVINTLILAYTGASMPLLLLISMSNDNASYTISNEFIAEEIVRTIIASLGLVLTAPITTLAAVFLFKRKPVSP